MSLVGVGGEEQIFNKYTTLYDHLVTAMLREHTEEKALTIPVTCRSADQTTTFNRHLGFTASMRVRLAEKG